MSFKRLILGLFFVLSITLMMGYPFAAEGADEINYAYIGGAQIHNPIEMLMKENKFLEAEGINVKWGEYMAGSYIMQSMASGEVDFAVLGIPPIMIARSQGLDLVMLASSNTEGSAIVAAPSIEGIKGLNGKKVGTPGIGSIQDAMLDKVERDYGIKVKHVSMKVSDMPLYLKKGEIDGFIAWEPQASQAAFLNYGHIVATSHDILPGHLCCALVVRGELARNNPELVKNVLRVYVKTFGYYRQHLDETEDLAVKKTGQRKEVISMALKNIQIPYPPYVSVESVKQQVEGLIKTGKIKSDIPDVDKFITGVNNTELLNEIMAGEVKK